MKADPLYLIAADLYDIETALLRLHQQFPVRLYNYPSLPSSVTNIRRKAEIGYLNNPLIRSYLPRCNEQSRVGQSKTLTRPCKLPATKKFGLCANHFRWKHGHDFVFDYSKGYATCSLCGKGQQPGRQEEECRVKKERLNGQ